MSICCFDGLTLTQDLIGRVTLDSATEFLFGSSVHSLAAGLPYPHNVAPPVSSGIITPTQGSSSTSSPLLPPPVGSVSATAVAQNFSSAFLEAQEAVAARERFSLIWPLLELRKDKTEQPMKVLNAFIQPIINEAVAKKNKAKEAEKKTNAEEIEEDETMLDHLVKQTEGRSLFSSMRFAYLIICQTPLC